MLLLLILIAIAVAVYVRTRRPTPKDAENEKKSPFHDMAAAPSGEHYTSEYGTETDTGDVPVHASVRMGDSTELGLSPPLVATVEEDKSDSDVSVFEQEVLPPAVDVSEVPKEGLSLLASVVPFDRSSSIAAVAESNKVEESAAAWKLRLARGVIDGMSRKGIMELTSYAVPPPIVTMTMEAVYLVLRGKVALGQVKRATKGANDKGLLWAPYRAMLRKTSFKRELLQFDGRSMDAATHRILRERYLDTKDWEVDPSEVSEVLPAFRNWLQNQCEAYEEEHGFVVFSESEPASANFSPMNPGSPMSPTEPFSAESGGIAGAFAPPLRLDGASPEDVKLSV